MAGYTLSSVTQNGVVTRGSGSYHNSMRVGNGTPSYATGVNGLFVTGSAEFSGKIHIKGGVRCIGAQTETLEGNTAVARTYRATVSGATPIFLGIDTTSAGTQGKVYTQVRWETSKTAGWKNQDGVATSGSIRQPESFRFNLTYTSGLGGILNVQNPLGASAIVKDVMVYLTTGSVPSARVDVGLGASSGNVNNLIDNIQTSATGIKDNIGDAGTEGGWGVYIAPTQYITAHRQAGGTVSALRGYCYITMQRV